MGRARTHGASRAERSTQVAQAVQGGPGRPPTRAAPAPPQERLGSAWADAFGPDGFGRHVQQGEPSLGRALGCSPGPRCQFGTGPCRHGRLERKERPGRIRPARGADTSGTSISAGRGCREVIRVERIWPQGPTHSARAVRPERATGENPGRPGQIRSARAVRPESADGRTIRNERFWRSRGAEQTLSLRPTLNVPAALPPS